VFFSLNVKSIPHYDRQIRPLVYSSLLLRNPVLILLLYQETPRFIFSVFSMIFLFSASAYKMGKKKKLVSFFPFLNLTHLDVLI